MDTKRIIVATHLLALLLFTVGITEVGYAVAATTHPDGVPRVAADAQRRRAPRRKAKRRMSKQVQTRYVPEGTWGGPHVRLQVREGGAEIEFDCAHGEIGAALTTDAEGRFDLPGTFAREGGPVHVGRERSGRPARYSGRIEGQTLTLTVRLTDTDQALDTFTLTHNSEGRLWKCR